MGDSRGASDVLLIELVKEGRHDAEIAVRLGITTGELRERKADLRERLGTQKYQELTDSVAPKASRQRRRFFFWCAGVAAGGFAILLVIANILAGGGGEAAEIHLTQLRHAPTAVPLRPAERVVLDGSVFEDLGPFLLMGGTGPVAVATTSNRPGLTVVELKATAYVSGSGSADWSVVSSSRTDAFLRGTTLTREFDLAIYTDRSQVQLRPLGVGLGPVLEATVPDGRYSPKLFLRATLDGEPLEVRISPEGHLFIAEATGDRSRVIDRATGAKLDIGQAQPFGLIAAGGSSSWFNACDAAPNAAAEQPGRLSCRVVWSAGLTGYKVPVAGTYACGGARSVSYETADVRLLFILRSPMSREAFACPPAPVSPGDFIVSEGEWLIAASTPAHESLSVVVGRDGTVYVGVVRGDVSCPCLVEP